MNAANTILVVEDNPANLELVLDLLTNAGYRVLTASDAERGLQLAAAEQPDLILMDISLPGKDGLQATAALKAGPHTAHLPIVALTAHAMPGDEEKARRAGCFAYLTKPINTRDFVRQIADFLCISAQTKLPHQLNP